MKVKEKKDKKRTINYVFYNYRMYSIDTYGRIFNSSRFLL